MESPVVLLKSAAFESDSYQRTDKVIKACKIITDILPYDKKSQVLIEESELMKYLMITLPMNPKAIDLIIHTMLDKFKKVHYFLKETWLGFLHIAQLEEDAERKKENPLKLFQLGVRSLIKSTILKELDSHITQPIRNQNYNEQITKSKEFIKTSVLGYVEKVIVFYLSDLRTSTPFKPDIPDLIKKFLANSNLESVILKTCSLLEKVRDIDPEFVFGDEVEEMATTKKDSQLNLRSQSSVTNIEEHGMERSSARKSKLEGVTSPSGTSLGASFKKSTSKKASILTHVEESKSSEDNSITEEEDEEEEEDEDDSPIRANNYAEGANSKIEEWLSDFKIGDVPVFNRTQFVEEFVKDEMNCEMLLSFIYDPRFHKISDCWKQKYPTLIGQNDNTFQAMGPSGGALNFTKLKDLKELHGYVIRSFKTMQLLCEERNYKFILETDFRLVERFFSGLYTSLTTKEDIACNLNHVLALIEFLMNKEPQKCIKCILQYNLPYKFLINIEFPYVQRFFMAMLNCLPNFKGLDQETYKTVLEYCRLTSFFIDVSKTILNGASAFPKEKLKLDYKPEGMDRVINFTDEEQEEDLKVCKIEKPEPKDTKKDISTVIIEEIKGFEIDIDGIKGMLQPIKKINKKDLIKKNENKTKSKPKSMKRYPSLMQKHFYDENTQATEESSPTSENKIISPTEYFSEVPQTKPNQTEQNSGKSPKKLGLEIPSASRSTPQKSPSAKQSSPSKTKAPSTLSPQKQASPTKKETTQKPEIKAKENPHSTLKDPIVINVPKLSGKEKAESPMLPSQVKFRDTPISSTMGSKVQVGSNKNIDKSENQAPERKTFIKEFDMEVIGKKELEQLRELYPTSTKNIEPTALDREAKKPEYKVKNIKANDQLALALCELLDILFQRMLKNGNPQEIDIPSKINIQPKDEELKLKYNINRNIGTPQVDYTQFWRIIFGDRGQVFNNLFINYLIKIKIHHFDEVNSGYISGVIANTILEQCKHNNYLKRFTENIQAICRENFSFFCKTLIQSYAWIERTDVKVYLQDYEVQQPLGSGRILLAKTLNLIIQNDEENEYSILNEINDTCWHTLVMWFFTKRTNTIYQQIFYSICQTTFLHSNEKIVLNILFKLNLIFYLYKIWTEIYQNNVLLKDNHVESIYAYIKLFIKLIAKTAETQEYNTLREQLSTNASWNMLKSAFMPKPKEKKKGAGDKSKIKSKQTMGLLSPSRNDTGNQSKRGTDNMQNTMSSLRTYISSPNIRTPRDSPPNSSQKKRS